MLKLSCKSGEPKWNPYWIVVLTGSSGTNYVPNKHESVDQYGSFAPSSDIMPYQNYPESLVNQNEIPVDLPSSSGTNYVLNEHEDVGRYGSFAISSDIMLYQRYPESLLNQNEIPVDLSS